ncbi:MAG: MFS transporter [Planctomycetota bacterium]|nr:MFS transporter [Planctomycetota bacterium]
MTEVYHVSNRALDYRGFRLLLAVIAFATLASQSIVFLTGYQVAKLYPTEPLYLGYLGLAQAIPALSLALVGGHAADLLNRKYLLMATLAVQTTCASLLLWASLFAGENLLWWIYPAMFLLGLARGFAAPTLPTLEATLVSPSATVQAATLATGVWQACAVSAPILAGFMIVRMGVPSAFAVTLVCFSLAAFCLLWIVPPKRVAPKTHEPILESIGEGIQFVFSTPVMWSSMALDLFAVLFGGAIAMLPLFAATVLHTDPIGLSYLAASPMVGALLSSIVCTCYPPKRYAGPTLLCSVFGFGICMIVFALSTSLLLSCVALFFSGLLDGISVVIRKSIMRLYSPDHMRGRVASVASIFIGASNEIGELESGIAAHYLGLTRSVWLGGVVTLMVVTAITFKSPQLRKLDLTKMD